jgi:hypothetical protein
MSDPLPNQDPIPLATEPVVPPASETVIQDFDRTATPFPDIGRLP